MSQPNDGGNLAENYSRHFVPLIGLPVARSLIETAALRPGERVLDVACGTGVVARLASERVGATGTVAGLDVNPGMLAVALSETSPEASISWHAASAEAMPLSDGSFDCVLCQMGLQFMADKHAALREMYRVLNPDGRLILSTPGPTPRLFAIMEEALARHVSRDAAGFVKQVFCLHDGDELATLVQSAGFRNTAVREESLQLSLPEPAEFLWQYVSCTPIAKAVAQADGARREALQRDVVEQWQEFEKEGVLILQVRVLVATGQK